MNSEHFSINKKSWLGKIDKRAALRNYPIARCWVQKLAKQAIVVSTANKTKIMQRYSASICTRCSNKYTSWTKHECERLSFCTHSKWESECKEWRRSSFCHQGGRYKHGASRDGRRTLFSTQWVQTPINWTRALNFSLYLSASPLPPTSVADGTSVCPASGSLSPERRVSFLLLPRARGPQRHCCGIARQTAAGAARTPAGPNAEAAAAR